MSNPFTRNEVSFVQTGFREKIEDYRPKRRKEIQEQAAMLRDLKIEAARKTQRALFEQKKLLKETSLKLKFQKFEWRQNKAEIRAMKKGWTWLVCAFGCVHVIGSRLEARKDLRRRTNSKLSFFYFAARFMGKLLMIRHIKRAKRAFVVLRRLRLPLKRKIAKIREKQKLIVVESVESYCTANLMHKLMEKWRSSILCIQRGLRPLLIARRQLYKKLIKDWSVVENDLFLRRNKANKKKKKYTSVPELVREYLIREYLKGKFRKFIHERNAAMETMEEYSKEYYNTRTEAVILGKSSVLLEAAAAMLPVLDLTISEETYLKFINVAEVNRLMWGKLSQKRIASPLFQMTNLDLEEPSVPVFNEARPRERRIALIPHMVD